MAGTKLPSKFRFIPEDFVFLGPQEDIDKTYPAELVYPLLPHIQRITQKADFQDVWSAIHTEDSQWDNYEDLSQIEAVELNNILERHFLQSKISIKAMSSEIMEKFGLDRVSAERIVRTEMTAIMNKAKELDWLEQDPDGTNKYRWAGPNDKRTTPLSKRIKDRTKDGVSLSDLKKIVKEESIAYHESLGSKFRPSRDFQSHINQRHTFVKVRG